MNKVKLGDCIELIIDNRGKTPPLAETGYELIETASINGSNKYPDYSKITKFVSEETYNTWFRKGHPNKNDILISTVGDIGKVAILKERRGSVAQNLIAIRTKKDVLNPDYLYYFLSSNKTQYILSSLNIGSVQPSLKVPHLLHLELELPTLNKQCAIANILNKLDEKLELNTQINQTLEQIAQTIFKSWFIDFDPVHAKANALANGQTAEQATQAAMAVISGKNTQELHRLQTANPEQYQQLWEIAEAFPSGFDEEGVPRGWELQKVENIVERLKSKQKLKKEDVTDEGQIPVFEQGAKILMGYCDEPAFNASLAEPMFIFGDHTCITKLSTKPFSIYQNVIALKGKKLPTYWVYYAVKDKQEFQEYRRHWMEFIVKEVIIPDNLKLCNYFSEKVATMCVLVDKILEENRILSEIRDELLPKLLSGDISNE